MALAVCGAIALVGCGSSDSSSTSSTAESRKDGPSARPPGPITTQSAAQAAKRPEPVVTVPDIPAPEKLIVHDLIKGSGKRAEKRDQLEVHLTSVRFNGGEFFESIWDKPFDFVLSQKDVNPGFVQGLQGMRVGGRRELIVPTELTSRYPIAPSENDPENALIYVVDLLNVSS